MKVEARLPLGEDLECCGQHRLLPSKMIIAANSSAVSKAETPSELKEWLSCRTEDSVKEQVTTCFSHLRCLSRVFVTTWVGFAAWTGLFAYNVIYSLPLTDGQLLNHRASHWNTGDVDWTEARCPDSHPTSDSPESQITAKILGFYNGFIVCLFWDIVSLHSLAVLELSM
jgi:hypothetical protein